MQIVGINFGRETMIRARAGQNFLPDPGVVENQLFLERGERFFPTLYLALGQKVLDARE